MNRRAFLGGATATAVTCSVVPVAVLGSPLPVTMPLKADTRVLSLVVRAFNDNDVSLLRDHPAILSWWFRDDGLHNVVWRDERGVHAITDHCPTGNRRHATLEYKSLPIGGAVS